MVFDVEVAGDEGRGLTPDPRGEGFGGLDPVVFYHLDLDGRGRRKRRKGGGGGEEEGGEGKSLNFCMGLRCSGHTRVSHPCGRRCTRCHPTPKKTIDLMCRDCGLLFDLVPLEDICRANHKDTV